METRKPIMETRKPVMETRKPVMETRKLVMETRKPAMETRKPAMETRKPSIETRKPVIESRKQTMETRRATPELKREVKKFPIVQLKKSKRTETPQPIEKSAVIESTPKKIKENKDLVAIESYYYGYLEGEPTDVKLELDIEVLLCLFIMDYKSAYIISIYK